MSNRVENGISGWLSPEGEFIPVEYGKHDEVARLLEEVKIVKPIQDKDRNYSISHGERLFELIGYIKFVYRLKGTIETESYVFFPQQFGYKGNITDEQIQWIEENNNAMTELQRLICTKYLKYNFELSS